MEILGSSPARVTHLNRGLGDLSLAWRDRGWRRLEFGPGEASKGLTQIKQGDLADYTEQNVGVSRGRSIQRRAKCRDTLLFRIIR
jgi:hypothetical protein